MRSSYAIAHVPTRRRNNAELRFHREVCKTIRQLTPNVYFRSDGGGLPLSQTQAAIFKSLQSNSGHPDITVFQPSRGYHGALWELKTETASLYLKDGRLSTQDHIQNQAARIQELNKLGYYANFAQGLDDFIKQYCWYMKIENTSLF